MRRVNGSEWKVRLAVACFAFLIPLVVCGQSTVAPPPITNPVPKKCKANSKDPLCKVPSAASAETTTPTSNSPAAENPFPVEESRHGGSAEGEALPAPAPSASGSPAMPASSANGLPGMPTGNDADPPAESNKPMRLPRDGYSTGGGSSSDAPVGGGGTSSSRSNDADEDVAPTTASPDAPVKASKLKDLGSSGSFSEAHAKLERTRFDDDLKVGKFYLQDGNPQGAYLRFKDAVEHVPDDPDARFGLAEAAAKLKKRDEAILNYREAIKADPGGDHDRASRAALKTMGVAAQ